MDAEKQWAEWFRLAMRECKEVDSLVNSRAQLVSALATERIEAERFVVEVRRLYMDRSKHLPVVGAISSTWTLPASQESQGEKQSAPQAAAPAAPKPRSISRPPGQLLDEVFKVVFPPKLFERVIRPVIADMQIEYFDALHSGRPTLARWVRARGYGILVLTLLRMIPDWLWRRALMTIGA
jgi:hypothetical protein